MSTRTQKKKSNKWEFFLKKKCEGKNDECFK